MQDSLAEQDATARRASPALQWARAMRAYIREAGETPSGTPMRPGEVAVETADVRLDAVLGGLVTVLRHKPVNFTNHVLCRPRETMLPGWRT